MFKLDNTFKKSVLGAGWILSYLVLFLNEGIDTSQIRIFAFCVGYIAYVIGSCKKENGAWIIEKWYEYIAFTVSVFLGVMFIWGVLTGLTQ